MMMAVMVLTVELAEVFSSKTIRPRSPCGAQCMRQVIRMSSVVCSEALHLQFGKGARPHLCMEK